MDPRDIDTTRNDPEIILNDASWSVQEFSPIVNLSSFSMDFEEDVSEFSRKLKI